MEGYADVDDDVMLDGDDDIAETAISNTSEPESNVVSSDKSAEWVEWRGSSDSHASPSPTPDSVDTSNGTESILNETVSKADDDIAADKSKSSGAVGETIGPSQSAEMDEKVREVEEQN